MKVQKLVNYKKKGAIFQKLAQLLKKFLTCDEIEKFITAFKIVGHYTLLGPTLI